MKNIGTNSGIISILAVLLTITTVFEAHSQSTERKASEEIVYYSVEDYSFQIPELNNKMSLNFKDKTVSEALLIIADQSNLSIAFDPDRLKNSGKVSIQENGIRVADALEKVLASTSYKSVITSQREILLKERPGISSSESNMMQIEIEGRVTDAQTGEPLPGVNVVVEGTTIGASTNSSGEYEIEVPDDAEALIFSFIGYRELREPIEGRTVIDVEMESSVELLDDVVVTSFGIEQERKQLGYSIQEVSGSDISETNEPNIVSSLQGRVAGVNIQNTSGAAGSGVDIIIRGINSLSPNADNQPLFVIDGIPVSNQTNSGNVLPSEGSNSPGSSEQFSFTNRIADINPNDIESLSILKGPSATALYGLRAANGAVVITTKKGSAGKPQVSLNSSVGFSEVNKVPEIQDQFQNGRFGALPLTVFGFQFWQLGPPVSESSTPVFNNFKGFFRTATNVSNSFSVSGGDENTTYFTSFSNVNNQGIVPNTDWDRTTFKLSGSQKVNNRFNINGSLTYSNSGGTRPTGGDKSIMSSLSFWASSNDVNDFLNPDGSQKNPTAGIIDNPRFFAENSTLEDDVDRIVGIAGFNYEINDWLSAEYQVGIDNFSDRRERFVPPNLDVGTQVNGFLIEENINYREINSNAFLRANYELTDKWRGSVLIGNQITDIDSETVNTRGEGLNIPDFRSLANTTNIFTGETAFVRRLVGVFTDARIEYDGTYFLSVTARNDWSSTLPEDNRSFFYPSVSLSYVFTETLGLADSNILPFGKLRFSWARVGKDAPPFSVGQTFQSAPGFPFGSTGGFTQDLQAGALSLEPERNTSIEIGAEARLFNNRASVDIAYFTQTSKDQIVAFPVSNATGLAQFTTNAGQIDTDGIELLTEGTPFQTRDFNWNIAVNWSTFSSDVVSMPEGLDVIEFANSGFAGVVNRIQEGGELGDLFGFTFDYDDQGRLLIADDGFPTIRTDTLVKVGNAFPDWQGGITNTFNYKNLSLSFLLEFKKGGQAYDATLRNSIRNGIVELTGVRNEEVVFNGVKADGTPNDIAVEVDENFFRSSTRFNRASEIIVQDTDWIRLRNARIAYSLPVSITEKLPVSDATFSVTGRNLFVSTPFRGFDPEGQQFSAGSNAFGFTGLNIPPTRSFTFSMNLRF